MSLMRLSRAFLSQTALTLGRSFWPLFAIVLIAGAMLWGPWVSLAMTIFTIAVAGRSL
jgi:hypothetical protein